MKGLREVLGPGAPESVNHAKQLARKVYGSCQSSTAPKDTEPSWLSVGRTSNENSKAAAYWNGTPELDHNEIVGWKSNPDLLRSMLVINWRYVGVAQDAGRIE